MLNGLYGYIFGGTDDGNNEHDGTQGAQSQDENSTRVTNAHADVIATPVGQKSAKRQLHDETIDDEWILVDDKHPQKNPLNPMHSGRSSPVFVAEPQIHSADENDTDNSVVVDNDHDMDNDSEMEYGNNGHMARRPAMMALPLPTLSSIKQAQLARSGRTLASTMAAAPGGMEPGAKRANMVASGTGKAKNRKAKLKANGTSGRCNDRKCQ